MVADVALYIFASPLFRSHVALSIFYIAQTALATYTFATHICVLAEFIIKLSQTHIFSV